VIVQPDSTAVRTALWRAMHVLVDPPPHVLTDDLGLRLADPGDGWRSRPDMDPSWTAGLRAAMAARGRFVEDLVAERVAAGVEQYVLLGAGLDTFAQRRPDLTGQVQVFEVDRPGPQAWKQRRLASSGLDVPDSVRFVPVDFEAADDWWQQLVGAGFDPARPAVVASTGVSMYLTEEANTATLKQLARLAPGSTLAMTFLIPPELLDDEGRSLLRAARDGASASGTPFLSFYAPHEVVALAAECGFRSAEHVSGPSLGDRYFTGRADGLRPTSGEDFLLAKT
jgi:methyltransferase (TIGR00027 family)